MDALPRPLLAVGLAASLLAGTAAYAEPDAGPGTSVRIADPPPPFRIYDIDRRERHMRALLAQMAGTPALSHQQADTALGQLDDIHRQEEAMKARHGGHLTIAIMRAIDARLNTLNRQLGLREAPR